MFWSPPCSAELDPDCPYVDWHKFPRADLAGITRSGHDRDGRQRFRCKLCNATFLRPPGSDGHKIGFKAYRFVEAYLARTRRLERPATVARRLGVERITVVRWEHQWTQASASGKDMLIPPSADLHLGRLARLIQDRPNAPYVIAAIDQEWFVRASVAEMRNYLSRKEFKTRGEILGELDELLDRRRPIDVRNRRLTQLGQGLARAFRDDLNLKPSA